MNSFREKYQQLKDWFQKEATYAIAFSGGVDSCLVLYACRQAVGAANTIAIIADSPSLKRKDLQVAREFCEMYKIQLEIIHTRELENIDYVSNPVNRCFFCKTTLYSAIEKEFVSKNPEIQMLNGSNASDYSDYRPGLVAAENYKVKSPLADCGLTKNDIRALAAYLKLPTWDKPASPCLSSRFAYGEHITREKLRQIEKAEEILDSNGFKINRVRYLMDKVSIEVEVDMVDRLKRVFPQLNKQFETIGLQNISIDEEGFRSGKLNSELKLI